MPAPQLLPSDGDPPDDPDAAELAPAERHRTDVADTPGTEHPLPASRPVGSDGAGA